MLVHCAMSLALVHPKSLNLTYQKNVFHLLCYEPFNKKIYLLTFSVCTNNIFLHFTLSAFYIAAFNSVMHIFQGKHHVQ